MPAPRRSLTQNDPGQAAHPAVPTTFVPRTPATVQAIRFDGTPEHAHAIATWAAAEHVVIEADARNDGPYVAVFNGHEWEKLRKGDWIVRLLDGTWECWSDGYMQREYEAVRR